MTIADENELFTPKAQQLSGLLKGIDERKVVLPNFQRPWVWEPPMVRELLISVAYRYPAGSLLTMPVSTGTFALRAFEGAGDIPANEKPGLMVLDGQQRLTSLYQAVFRQDGVHYNGRKYFFYLHVPTLLSDLDGIEVGDPYFDEALFYVMEDKKGRKIRYDGLRELYDISSREDELKHGAMPLWVINNTDEQHRWRDDFLFMRSEDSMAKYREMLAQWERLVKPWSDRIKNYPFPVVELRPDMPLGAICHIFEKVNSTGKPLDVFDLCTAILWAQGFKLNEEWKKTTTELRQQHVLPMQPLVGKYFLQGMALLSTYNRKTTNTDSSKRIAVSCREGELMKLSRDDMKTWWKPLVRGYREAGKFMADKGVIAERILPYSTLIVPLSAIFAWIAEKKPSIQLGAAWPKIEQWYWCSVFSQRYSSRIEAASATDMEEVLRWLDGGQEPDVVKTFSFRADALQEIKTIRNAIYKGVLCLLVRDGSQDWGDGAKLSTNLFYDTRSDHHHIYPKKRWEELGVDKERGDSIVNKTLIGAKVNRSIGGSRPSEYLTTWRERLGQQKFDAVLKSHQVEPATLASDDWELFVKTRRETLRALVEQACGIGKVVPFSDEVGAVTDAPEIMAFENGEEDQEANDE